jgi:(p)ppGpp synthase/HD superfamily hydrolase
MDIVEKARIFATAAHAAVDQRRKYTNEPYIVHPKQVADFVANVPGATPEMIAAAWLHDVVEDTKVTNEDIAREFGDKVGEYVGWVTDISRPEYGIVHSVKKWIVIILQEHLEKRRQLSWLTSSVTALVS